MASVQAETPALEASLLSLRSQLVAGGMSDTAADDALTAVRRVSEDSAYATRLRQVLAQPAGLVQAILSAAPRRASAWTVVGLMVLAALTGPLLAFAVLDSSSQTAPAIGDPFQAYAAHLPSWVGVAAAIAGVVLLVLFLLAVARYLRPTLLGFFGGLVGGIAEIAVAVLPWVGIIGARTTCVAGSGCTVKAAVPEQIGIFAAVCFAIPFVLALTGVSGTLALWLQRRRMLAAIRSA